VGNFPFVGRSIFHWGWALRGNRHDKQLEDPSDGTHTKMMERSVLGLIYTYNSLPQAMVDISKIASFQRALQHGLKNAARKGAANWDLFLRNGLQGTSVKSFQGSTQRENRAQNRALYRALYRAL